MLRKRRLFKLKSIDLFKWKKHLWFINTQSFNLFNADQINSYDNDVLQTNGKEMRQNASNFRNIIGLFLKQIMRDCMLALQERHSYQRKKLNDACALKVNDIVLLKSDSAPRLSWWKGKIEKIVFGNDDLVCGADVRVYQDNSGKIKVIHSPL